MALSSCSAKERRSEYDKERLKDSSLVSTFLDIRINSNMLDIYSQMVLLKLDKKIEYESTLTTSPYTSNTVVMGALMSTGEFDFPDGYSFPNYRTRRFTSTQGFLWNNRIIDVHSKCDINEFDVKELNEDCLLSLVVNFDSYVVIEAYLEKYGKPSGKVETDIFLEGTLDGYYWIFKDCTVLVFTKHFNNLASYYAIYVNNSVLEKSFESHNQTIQSYTIPAI